MPYPYAKQAVRKPTQREPLPGKHQVRNSAGGFVFKVDPWTQLDRFLILGTEAGSYYASPQKLTKENTKAIEALLAMDGPRVIKRIAEISLDGRAPKNDPAIFALALAAVKGKTIDDRKLALASLPQVCRIGTHLFHFLQSYLDLEGGWSRYVRKAFANWYQFRKPEKLVEQLIKYQQRDGVSHKDVIKLAHPKPQNEQQSIALKWAVKGWEGVGTKPHPDQALVKIWAFERAKKAEPKELIHLIEDYGLPHECVPNEHKGNVKVWEAMLPNMGVTALIRNLGKMTSVGLLKPLTSHVKFITDRLTDIEGLKAGRVHPYQILLASKIYAQGHGDLGKLSWSPNQRVIDALDDAFYLAFKLVEPTGKRFMLALDVSPSMSGAMIQGYRTGKGGKAEAYNTPITAQVGSAVMSMVTARAEEEHYFYAFNDALVKMPISAKQRLDEVVQTTEKYSRNWGGTDCALPMIHALKERIPVDVFCVYTDNETHSGRHHPNAALEEYRQRMNIPAKLVVIGMTATQFSIANPQDAGQMDVVGFDTSAPALISDFARG